MSILVFAILLEQKDYSILVGQDMFASLMWQKDHLGKL